MIFKKFISWLPDEMPETTEAIVLVSECGSVIKKLPYKRWSKKNGSYSNVKEHVYKVSTNRGKFRNREDNYLCVHINDKAYSVHQVVARAFLPNPEMKAQVNHIDGNKRNNHVSNLEWCTNEENMSHAIKNGLVKKTQNKYSDDYILKAKKALDQGMLCRDLKRKMGITFETVRVRLKKIESSFSS
jgi:hypothetical protein